VLTISRADSTTQYPMGVNRFECRTCPYEDIIGDKSYYEKTEMKQKEVEDVFGGANEFANADSVASKLQTPTSWGVFPGSSQGRLQVQYS
jgi:DNA-directed RNA polymerase III subunit RPC11